VGEDNEVNCKDDQKIILKGNWMIFLIEINNKIAIISEEVQYITMAFFWRYLNKETTHSVRQYANQKPKMFSKNGFNYFLKM